MARRYRFLNPDGTVNVERIEQNSRVFEDFYHHLFSESWLRFGLTLVAGYFIINLLFAVGYYACGAGSLEGIVHSHGLLRLLDCFFFSVQTFATIGYGRITPVGIGANILVTIEALVGLSMVALSTGLMFARFSRPTARVTFSRFALMSMHDGVRSFVFRMANDRGNQIVDARLDVTLIIDETTQEGERYRNFYDLALERNRSPIFSLSWTAVHPVTSMSPLFGKSVKDLIELNAEFIISLTGLDETFSQTIHARYSYIPEEIVWDGQFADVLTRNGSGILRVDLSKIHDVSETTN